MGARLRTPSRSNGVQSWRSVGDLMWENNEGSQVTIYSDVVISVTTLENKLMHNLAAKQLETDYNLCLHRNAPEFAHGFQYLFANMKKTIQSPKRPDIHIFGMSLEAASKDERIRFGSKIIRINNQYKLHIPMFVLKAVKCIERFGIGLNGIFIRPGEYAKLHDIRTTISNGLEYKFDNYCDTFEVAELLKTYFQMMPEGIFTNDLESRFLYTRELALPVRICVLNLLVQVLPQINREALFLLMGLLFRMTRSPWAQVNSYILDHIFEPVLCRYNGNVIGERYGLVQVLIDYFPAIFGLQYMQLDAIYRQMNMLHPRNMSIHLRKRSMQCNDESSDILETLKIFHASMDEQQKMTPNLGSTGNNLNTSSVRIPYPIRFNITPFALPGQGGAAEPVGMPIPVITSGPSSSFERNRLPGAYGPVGRATVAAVSPPSGIFRFPGPWKPFATSELLGRVGPVGSDGIAEEAGPSEPAEAAASGNNSRQRGSVFTTALGLIREQDIQDNIRPSQESIRGDSKSSLF